MDGSYATLKHTYMSQNSFTTSSQEAFRGAQAPKHALRDNSFPGSLRLKLSQCVTHASSLAFILSLGAWKMPLYRRTPLLSASPGHFLCLHWRGQCHSLGGGVPPGKLALILIRSFSQIKTTVLGGALK